MKNITFLLFYTLTLFCNGVFAQSTTSNWYKESNNQGVIIQNSFPKGGPYTESVKGYFNISYLVFFSRILNKTDKPFQLNLDLKNDSIKIPNASNTYMKLFIPYENMTFDKQNLFSYGLTGFQSFDESNTIQKKLEPEEDFLFYVVAIFYQTKPGNFEDDRGGNRIEIFPEGIDLYLKMTPQIQSMCLGYIRFD